MFGFLKTLGKIGAGVAGFAIGGPAGAAAGYGAASKILSGGPEPEPSYQPPPAFIVPPAPLPPPAQLPYLSYTGGGAGAGPVNTYQPMKASGGTPTMMSVARANAKTSHRGRKTKTRRARASGSSRKKSTRKPKFGSPAFRKKYLGHKK